MLSERNVRILYSSEETLIRYQDGNKSEWARGVKTYDCDLAAKVILDLARLDRIGGIFRNHLVQVWFFVRNE